MANIEINITENGTTTLATSGKYCDRNVDVIVDVPSGGGVEVEPIVLTGTQAYGCAGMLAGNYMNNFGNTISTKDITSAEYMFYRNAAIEKIPFALNFKKGWQASMGHMFDQCNLLEELPKITNALPNTFTYVFAQCHNLRSISDEFVEGLDMSYVQTYNYAAWNYLFPFCYSLRHISENLLKQLKTTNTSAYSGPYYYLVYSDFVLDEVKNLAVQSITYTSNAFMGTFYWNFRLKSFTFETNEDGSSIVAPWKTQTIPLHEYIGYAQNKNYITSYNSGITTNTEIKDDATYQALKDNPDSWTTKIEYSRYNHDSAVETINSLPDTSAYLAEKGGTNTIKFKGASGSLTDGGAINTLTEEEIAVAAAKGWTVTYV